MSADHLYFKFKPINKYLIESLVKPSVYFPAPDKLNDPFDCRLDIRESFKRAAEVQGGNLQESLGGHSGLREELESILKSIEGKFQTFGVCSFSLLELERSFDEPLLWSHYADSHKGVCLLYRFPETFLNDQKKIFGVDKVQYGTDVLKDWLVKSDVHPDKVGNFVNGLVKTCLTAKNKPWEYEKEVRIIRITHGALDIHSGFLEQVCFGLQTPQADRGLVMKLAREFSGCEKFCQVVHANTDFGIAVKEL